MNNCVYTKLSAEVPDSELLQFGELRFNVIKTTNANVTTAVEIIIRGDAPEAPVIKAYGGTFSVEGVSYTEYTMTKGNNGFYTLKFNVINDNYTIGITNAKYYLSSIVSYDNDHPYYPVIVSIDVEDLNFSPYLNTIKFPRILASSHALGSGVFNPISTRLSVIIAYDKDVQMPISVLGRQPNLNTIQAFFNYSGDLSDIANCTNTKSLYLQESDNITGDIADLYQWTQQDITMRFNSSPNIGGSIDALADAMVARTNPKTSGTVDIYGVNTSAITCSVAGDSIRITFDPSAAKGYTISAI